MYIGRNAQNLKKWPLLLTKRRTREKRENGGEKREYERKEIKREKKREMGEKKDVPKMCRS